MYKRTKMYAKGGGVKGRKYAAKGGGMKKTKYMAKGGASKGTKYMAKGGSMKGTKSTTGASQDHQVSSYGRSCDSWWPEEVLCYI